MKSGREVHFDFSELMKCKSPSTHFRDPVRNPSLWDEPQFQVFLMSYRFNISFPRYLLNKCKLTHYAVITIRCFSLLSAERVFSPHLFNPTRMTPQRLSSLAVLIVTVESPEEKIFIGFLIYKHYFSLPEIALLDGFTWS